MHISQAQPAEKFYRVPMAAHRALLADAQLGKGHALTLMLLASYLWSAEPLDGTRAEWAQALSIGAQTFEAHVPQLGRAGCLSYIQSHCGYYVFYGLTQDDQESAALRAAWQQAEAEFDASGEARKQRYVWITRRVEALKFTHKDALKFTLPVVDTTTTSCLSVLEDSREDALKVIQSPEKIMSPVRDTEFAALVVLYEQEIGGTLTALMLDEFNELWGTCADLERWRYAFRASIGKGNRWAYVKAIIEHPERDRRSNGRTTSSRDSRKVAGGTDAGQDAGNAVSHDIDAWFGV